MWAVFRPGPHLGQHGAPGQVSRQAAGVGVGGGVRSSPRLAWAAQVAPVGPEQHPAAASVLGWEGAFSLEVRCVQSGK